MLQTGRRSELQDLHDHVAGYGGAVTIEFDNLVPLVKVEGVIDWTVEDIGNGLIVKEPYGQLTNLGE